jgi:uncharacterized DUF497 family protein
VRFEWDPAKARQNAAKHGVAFAEACLVFSDPGILSVPDVRHSHEEERWVSLGAAGPGVLLLVVHTYRAGVSDEEEVVRIISARRATARERGQYRKGRR